MTKKNPYKVGDLIGVSTDRFVNSSCVARVEEAYKEGGEHACAIRTGCNSYCQIYSSVLREIRREKITCNWCLRSDLFQQYQDPWHHIEDKIEAQYG